MCMPWASNILKPVTSEFSQRRDLKAEWSLCQFAVSQFNDLNQSEKNISNWAFQQACVSVWFWILRSIPWLCCCIGIPHSHMYLVDFCPWWIYGWLLKEGKKKGIFASDQQGSSTSRVHQTALQDETWDFHCNCLYLFENQITTCTQWPWDEFWPMHLWLLRATSAPISIIWSKSYLLACTHLHTSNKVYSLMALLFQQLLSNLAQWHSSGFTIDHCLVTVFYLFHLISSK